MVWLGESADLLHLLRGRGRAAPNHTTAQKLWYSMFQYSLYDKPKLSRETVLLSNLSCQLTHVTRNLFAILQVMNRSLWAGSSPLHHILSVPLARHVLVYHLARFRLSTSGHVVVYRQARVRISTSGNVAVDHQARVCLSIARQKLLSLAAANQMGFHPVFRTGAEYRKHRRALCRRSRVGNTGHFALAFSLLGRLTHIVAAAAARLFQEPVAHKSNYLIFCLTRTHYFLTFTFPFTKTYTHGVDRYSGSI